MNFTREEISERLRDGCTPGRSLEETSDEVRRVFERLTIAAGSIAGRDDEMNVLSAWSGYALLFDWRSDSRREPPTEWFALHAWAIGRVAIEVDLVSSFIGLPLGRTSNALQHVLALGLVLPDGGLVPPAARLTSKIMKGVL